jgi:prepilin-type N-terminal cleavage/methylation domain-containing protein
MTGDHVLTKPLSRVHSRRGGFTLLELMVAFTIVAILAGLSVAGLAAARLRAKIDKTKLTIQKIHAIVMPQYEEYLRHRVPLTAVPATRIQLAQDNLQWIRRMIIREMPDTWADVQLNPAAVTSLPAAFQTAPVFAYASSKTAANTVPNPPNSGAECLYLIVTRGRGDPEAMQQFHATEVGDTDGDGSPEFLDAWARPITFIRWAPGLPPTPLQKPIAAQFPDPFDPLRVDSAGFALIPLIVSSGPDGNLGLNPAPVAGWDSQPSLTTIVSLVSPQPGFPTSAADAADNITNHDLVAP